MKKLLALLATFLISVSLFGQNDKVLFVGIDTSMDCFLPLGNHVYPSFGLGMRARLGRPDQWVNLVGGVRYIYGKRLSGFQVPILMNVNLLRGKRFSGYLGGGFEFDFAGTYYGAVKYQAGLAGRHIDLRIFYKPYQGDLGAGFTYYF
jgi:hypothetical protein